MVREADLFSDRFFIYCFHSENPLRYFLYAWAILTGRQSQLADVTMFPAQQVRCEEIDSQKEQVYLQVDGEFVGPLPCTIEIVPDALTLLVPPKF